MNYVTFEVFFICVKLFMHNPAFRPSGPQLTEDGGNPRPGRRIHANHLPPEVKGQRPLR